MACHLPLHLLIGGSSNYTHASISHSTLLNAPTETVGIGQFHFPFGLQKYVFSHKCTEAISDIPGNRSAQHLGVPFNRLGYKAGPSSIHPPKSTYPSRPYCLSLNRGHTRVFTSSSRKMEYNMLLYNMRRL